MQQFKKNKKLIIGGISLLLVSGISFCLKSKEENKTEVPSRELIAMFVQNENGEYNVNTSKEFPKDGYVLNTEKSICKNGGILSQDPMTKNISMKTSNTDQCTLYFDKMIPTLKDFYDNIIERNDIPNFTNPATTDETENGLFKMEDDYGTSYYYRGTAPNNYVKFARTADGQDMWWRIIRFNGNGTVRMQYDGVGAAGENTYTRDFALTNLGWNWTYSDNKYVGWMHGDTGRNASTSKEEAQRNEIDSATKSNVDTWYKNNVVDTGFSNYIADAIFCNDRSFESRNTGTGYGKSLTYYGARGRTGVSEGPTQPRFTCPQENDKFTVEEESGGNGALTYPVGLITADEIVAAGSGKYHSTNNSFYINKGSTYWTFSPYNAGNTNAVMFVVGSSMGLSYSNVDYRNAIAPVINLKAEYLDKFQGNGTLNHPYHLVE